MAKRGVNKVILVGNLGQDPETRYMPNGNPVTNLSLATSESYKDKNTGQEVDKTEWHKIVIFGKLAEIAGEYLRKGSQVYFEGKLQTRKWTDQQGQEKYTTEIVIDGFEGVMQMIGSKPESGKNQGYAPQAQTQQQQYNQAPQQGGGYQQPQNAPQQNQQGAPQQNGGFTPKQHSHQ